MERRMEAATGVEGRSEATSIADSSAPPPPAPSTELINRTLPLPSEIIQLIFEHLAPDGSDPTSRRPADLARCCLVSSAFRQLATPALFRRLFIELPKKVIIMGLSGYRTGWEPRSPQVSLDKVTARLELHSELQQHPRTLFLGGRETFGGENYARALKRMERLFAVLPRLASLELEFAQDGIVEAIAGTLPKLPLGATIRHLKLGSFYYGRKCDEGVRASLRGLEQLQDLELSVWLDDSWAASEDEVLPSQLKRLRIGSKAHSALPMLTKSSSTSLRTLSLDLGAEWSLPSSTFSLSDFPNLDSLSLLSVNPEILQQFIPQIIRLTSLHHLTIYDPSDSLYPSISLSSSLPTGLRELDLDFKASFSDILELAQDERFDDCRLAWLAWSEVDLEKRWETERWVRRVQEAMRERAERKWERSFPLV